MATTRLDQIAMKVRTLQDYQNRVMQQTSATNAPSGLDFLPSLKYLSQTFVTILKDTAECPNDDKHIKQLERERLARMPSMNYSEIFHTILSLYDIVPFIAIGQKEMARALIGVTNCLLCFLNRDLLDCIPYTVICVLPLWPVPLQKDLLNMICFSLLPMILGSSHYLENPSYASSSIEAILAISLQYATAPWMFSQIVESCMQFHSNVARCLLKIIATSTSAVRAVASNLLFHYYPQCKPHNVESDFTYTAWNSPNCMNPNCSPAESAILRSSFYSFCPKDAATISELPPPLYLCKNCAELDLVPRENLKVLPGPLEHPLAKHCESPNCSSKMKPVCICFSHECMSMCDSNKPVRLCQECHAAQHFCLGLQHRIQSQLPSPYNNADTEGQHLITEAIIKLLEEAEYSLTQASSKTNKQKEQNPNQLSLNADQLLASSVHDPSAAPANLNEGGVVAYKDRRLLPRSAIWLINSVCASPYKHNNAPGTAGKQPGCQQSKAESSGQNASYFSGQKPKPEYLGRLIAGVVHWFQCVFVQQNDSIGNYMEVLKTEISDGWLTDMLQACFDIFIMCLMPLPPEYARIGRHWDSLESRTHQIRQGLHTIYCLMPYNVITPEVWGSVVPHWLDMVSTQVEEKELDDLKFVFSKLFDQQMCAVFSVSELFSFFTPYFHCALVREQERALVWINTLSKLGVTIPLSIMSSLLTEGIQAIRAQVIYRAEYGDRGIDVNNIWYMRETHLFPKDKSQVPQQVVSWLQRKYQQDALLLPSVASESSANSQQQTAESTSPQSELTNNPTAPVDEEQAEADLAIETDCERISTCFILMLDSLLKQMNSYSTNLWSELQEFKAFQGLDTTYARSIIVMLNVMLTCPLPGRHACLDFTSPADVTMHTRTTRIRAASKYNPSDDSDLGPEIICELCDEQAVLFDLVFSLMQLLCPPMETKLSQLYVMEADDFNAAIAAMTSQDNNSSKEGSKKSQKVASFDLGTGNVSSDSEESRALDQSTTEASSGLQEIKVTFSEAQVETIPNTQVLNGELPQISSWNINNRIPTSSINVGTVDTTPNLIEFSSARSATVVKCKTPESKTHESEANQRVSDIRVIDERNTEVHLAKSSPVYYWETSLGKFEFSPEEFPSKLKLLYIFIRFLREYSDHTAQFCVVKCIRLMLLHADTFSGTDYQEHLGFLVYLQEKYLLDTFWELIHAHESQAVQQSIPLILYGICQPLGQNKFWEIIRSWFTSSEWETRFEAVEKVCTILQFVDPKQIAKQLVIQSSLALCSAFAINSMTDVNENVALRALIGLKSVRKTSMKFMCECLEVQFDGVIEDRPLILSTFELLHNSVSDIPALSWDFFARRFNTLMLESQYEASQGRYPYFPCTAASSSETAALNADVSRDGKMDKAKATRERSGPVTLQPITEFLKHKTGKIDLSRAASTPGSAPPSAGFENAANSRSNPVGATFEALYQMSDALKQCNVHFSVLDRVEDVFGAFGGSSSANSLYNKSCSEVDKETVHLMISLLMKFIARPDPERPGSQSLYMESSKSMSSVTRHLNYLLSYNPQDKSFFHPPHKLRTSVVLNAVMTHMAEVLDYNHEMGTSMMHLIVLLLQYLPSNRRIASSSGIGLPLLGSIPDYSLWLLEPHVRHQWLMSLLVILYKYRLDVSTQIQSVKNLIRITINTIAGHVHVCQYLEKPPSPVVSHTVTPSMSRKNSKDLLDVDDLTEDGVTAAQTETDSTAEDKSSSSFPQIHYQSVLNPSTNIPHPLNTSTLEKDHSRDVQHLVMKQVVSKIAIKVSEHDGSNSSTELLSADNGEFFISQPVPPSFPSSHVKPDSEQSDVEKAEEVDEQSGFMHQAKAVEDGNQSDTGEMYEFASEEEEMKKSSAAAAAPVVVDPKPTASSAARMRHQSNPDCTSKIVANAQSATGALQSNSSASGNSALKDRSLNSSAVDVNKTSTSKSKAMDGPMSFFKSPKKYMKRDSANKLSSIVASSWRDLHCLSPNAAAGGGSSGSDRGGGANSAGGSAGLGGYHANRRNSSFSVYARFNEDEGAMVLRRCLDCKAAIEDFDEKTLSLSITVLRTFVYRDPVGSAPFLLDIFVAISRLGQQPLYNWQAESKLWVRDTCLNVAKQFMRCTLHQLAPYGLFNQLFITPCIPNNVFSYIAQCLIDFHELSLVDSIDLLLCNLNMRKTLPTENLMTLLNNMAVYMSNIHFEGLGLTPNVMSHFDNFFKKLAPCMPLVHDVTPLLKIASILFRMEKIPGALTVLGKTQVILHSFGTLLSYVLQASVFTVPQIFELMESVRSPTYVFHFKVDKMEKNNNSWQTYYARVICQELVNGLKFKVNLPVENLVRLVQFAILDLRFGGPEVSEISSGPLGSPPTSPNPSGLPMPSVLLEVLRSGSYYHSMFFDLFEFLGDIHTINKVRANARTMNAPNLTSASNHTSHNNNSWTPSVGFGGMNSSLAASLMNHHNHNNHNSSSHFSSSHGAAGGAGGDKSANLSVSLHEDTLGGELKTGVAQIIACVLSRDPVANCKQFVPWLFSPPSTTQQGPKEFIECVGYVRMLSWLLLGSLTSFRLTSSFPSSSANYRSAQQAGPQPTVLKALPPAECNNHIAEYILVLLTGFMEHNSAKSSILTMSALFHAFICCQLWTVYLEQLGGGGTGSGAGAADGSVSSGETIVLEFWGKVTPGILQLLSLSKSYSETVVLHFLSLLEALQECNSTVLAKLLPMWKTLFMYSNEKMSSTTQLRLQNCENAAPPSVKKEDTKQNNNVIARWLNRLQFKISQVELQTSNVSTTFLTI
ncbi:protein unc-79 homolog isoform X3 [Convolutriloba macropyga]|uniref:protein unc-79 homolog isoform X3 n=1 Tax=Convolutriloba macropyga TaxID=536237 RepID=UPI003F522E58